MRSILFPVMLDLLAIVVGTLDSLPKIGRAMLSAGVFAGVLCYIASRFPADDAAVSVAYRKTTILALLTVPLLVYAVVDWRLVLIVDELPGNTSGPDALWWALAVGWAIGVLWHVAASIRANRELASRYRELEPVDEKLADRLAHWQRRLELGDDVRVGFGSTSRPLCFGKLCTVIVLPRAVAHWPMPVQDVVLLGLLAHVKRGNLRWLGIGEFVAALYWPIPWVRVLVAQFKRVFERTSDSLALSCYRDRMGYERGLKHAEQRLTVDACEMNRATHLGWGDGGSLEDRQRYLGSTLRDPSYDRVFWSMLPALAVVILLTGTTLEKYEEIEPRRVVFVDNWESDFRSRENEPLEIKRQRRWVVIRKPRLRYYVPDVPDVAAPDTNAPTD